MVYEYKGSMRTIFMDKHQDAPVDSWMGWSNGRWEGDTLVVDVTGFNGHQWLDRAGNFLSDTAHVVERWTPRGRDPHDVRGDDRRSGRIYAALEDQFPGLPAAGTQYSAARVQLRALCGRDDVHPAWAVQSTESFIAVTEE
jgi:hypothetical protein